MAKTEEEKKSKIKVKPYASVKNIVVLQKKMLMLKVQLEIME